MVAPRGMEKDVRSKGSPMRLVVTSIVIGIVPAEEFVATVLIQIGTIALHILP